MIVNEVNFVKVVSTFVGVSRLVFCGGEGNE